MRSHAVTPELHTPRSTASFNDVLEKRFPESRRKAYYLMSILEHLPPKATKEPQQIGWTKGRELASWRAGTGSISIVHPWCTKRGKCQGRSSDGQLKRNLRERK